jgi:hypothetical protein
MPNVPNVLGVPPLSSYAANAVTLLAVDLVASVLGAFAPQWGIFLDGSPVVVADSVISVGYKQGWRIADYPIEGGGFVSYDKVDTPYDARVRFSTGGSDADRQALLDSVATIAGSTQVFDIVTPETVYADANVLDYDYDRTATEGVGLLQIDVRLQEVRLSATAAFSSTGTQAPSGASPQSGGVVLPQTPTQTQQQMAAPLLTG